MTEQTTLRPRMETLARRFEQRRLGDLVFRHDLQVRAIPKLAGAIAVDEATVDRYLALYQDETDLGELTVVDTPQQAGLVADGNHRGAALKRLHGQDWRDVEVDVQVYTGTEQDARMLACELNGGRGLQFQGGDISRVAETYLSALFEQGVNPSDMLVARILGISRGAVMQARRRIEHQFPDLPAERLATRTNRDGQSAQVAYHPRTPPASRMEPFPDTEAAYRPAPAGPPPRQALQRYAAPPQPERRFPSAVVDQVVAQRRAEAEAPRPVVEAGDPVALTLRWTFVDGNGEPHDGTATTPESFKRLPLEVKQRLRALLQEEREV